MRNHSLKLLIPIYLLILLPCKSNADSSSYLFSKLNSECNDLSESNFSPLNGCQCDANEVIHTDRLNSHIACGERKPFPIDSMCDPINGCLLSADKVLGLGGFFPEIIGLGINIKFDKDSDRSQFLRSLGNKNYYFNYWYPSSDYFQNTLINIHVGSPANFNESDNPTSIPVRLGIVNTLLNGHNVTGNETAFNGVFEFYAPDVDRLMSLLGLNTPEVLDTNYFSNDFNASSNPHQRILHRAYEHFIQFKHDLELQENWILDITKGDNCNNVCSMRLKEHVLPDVGLWSISLYQEVLKGGIHKKFMRLTLNESQKNKELIVQLSSNFTPSYILLNEFQHENSISRVSTLYDVDGNELHTRNEVIIDSAALNFKMNSKNDFDVRLPSIFYVKV